MEWQTLEELREGAIFTTQDGVLAVKSEYRYYQSDNPQPLCILLASGEYAHFPDKERTLVYEIDVNEWRAALIGLVWSVQHDLTWAPRQPYIKLVERAIDRAVAAVREPPPD